ncbi:YfhO family protein [Candidatus Woesearchaeota archaeon]|nr:YfhO family protein [Candidatus Woesearchaeota archaeon]
MKNKSSLKFFLLLLVLTLLFFNQILLNPNKILYSKHSDIPAQFSIWKYIEHSSFTQWNPYLFSGTPLLANPHVGYFFPLSLAFLPLNPDSSFGYGFIILLFIAGLGTFLYCRQIGLKQYSSLTASVIFMFSAFFTTRIIAGHYYIVSVIALTPLIFYLFEKTITEESYYYALLTALVWSFQLLAGQTHLFFYSSFTLLIYFFLRLINLYFEKRSIKPLFKPVFLVAISFIFLLSLSSIQLIPSFQLSTLSTRTGGTSYEFASSFSLPSQNLATVILPNLFGTPAKDNYFGYGPFWEHCLYIGIIPIILSLISLTKIKDKDQRFIRIFTILGIFSVLFSLGKYTPFFKFFYLFIPGFNLFRIPASYLFLFCFSGAILSAYGLEFTLEDKISVNLKKFISTFLILISILAIISVITTTFLKPTIIVYGKTLAEQKYYDIPEGHTRTNSLQEVLSKVDSVFNTIYSSLITFTCILLLSTLAFYLLYKSKLSKRQFFASILILILVDLWFFGLPMVSVEDPSKVYHSNPVINFLNQDDSYFRVFDLANIIPAQLAVRNNIFSVSGYDPIILKHYADFTNLAIPTDTLALDTTLPLVDHKLTEINNIEILNLLNVKYIISEENISKFKKLQEYNYITEYNKYSGLTGKISSGYLYLNKDALPRAYTFTKAKKLTINKQTIFYPLDPIEQDITYFSPNEITIKVNTSKKSLLVLSEVSYPGWNVYINEEPAELKTFNKVFRATEINPGKYILEFRFEPSDYKIGKRISILSLIILVFILIKTKLSNPL